MILVKSNHADLVYSEELTKKHLEVYWAHRERAQSTWGQNPPTHSGEIDYRSSWRGGRRKFRSQSAPHPLPSDFATSGFRFFVSYNHLDSGIVAKLRQTLEARGYGAWVAGAEITPGQVIARRVVESMQDCDYLLLYASSHCVTSGWIPRECAHGIKQLGLPSLLVIDGTDELLKSVLRVVGPTGEPRLALEQSLARLAPRGFVPKRWASRAFDFAMFTVDFSRTCVVATAFPPLRRTDNGIDELLGLRKFDHALGVLTKKHGERDSEG